MKTPNWTEFRRLIYIDAPMKDLYRKWASQEGMESWFLKYAPYFNASGEKRKPHELCQSGDNYTWHWHNWEGEHKGKVNVANGTDQLVIDFENSILEINLYIGRNMTCVDLLQKNIPTDDLSKYNIYHGSSCGWTFWLTNLKATVEHGISLNDAAEGLIGTHNEFDVVNI